MSKKSRGVIFSDKTNPAGMPTQRTGDDNIKNQLKLIKIRYNTLKSIKNH